MHPVFQAAFDEVSSEIAHFDAMSAGVHPWGRPHCWSVQQVVEHLILTLDATRDDIAKRLAKGRPERRMGRTRAEWLLQLMMLSVGYMPKGVGAPHRTSPPKQMASPSVRDLTQRLRDSIEALDATLDQTRQRFGMERVGRHFLLGPLRVDQWRRYHVLHLRHHLRQMADIRKTLSVAVVREPKMARV